MANSGRPYRAAFATELAGIEARRVAAGISIDELAGKAGIDRSTYFRMRKSGLAFRRHVNALVMALRTLESDRRWQNDAFPFAQPRADQHP